MEGWLVISMDNLLIYSDNNKDHEEQTKQVLQHMKELDLYLKLEKCSFNISEVEYLGMIVKPGPLAMDPVKVAGIADWPVPSTVRDVQFFLGFATFYCCFTPHYSDTACPLLDLTKKTHPWSWDQSYNDAFMVLKATFTSQPVLYLPDLSAPFAISTNASKHTSGGVLLQKDTNGDWHPCAYLSQHSALLSEPMTSMIGNCSWS